LIKNQTQIKNLRVRGRAVQRPIRPQTFACPPCQRHRTRCRFSSRCLMLSWHCLQRHCRLFSL